MGMGNIAKRRRGEKGPVVMIDLTDDRDDADDDGNDDGNANGNANGNGSEQTGGGDEERLFV